MEQQVIAEIERLGGSVEPVPQCPAWTPKSFDYLEVSKRVWKVYLFDTQVSDNDLKHFGRLAHPISLLLNDPQITDAGLEHLEQLTSLHVLFLDNSQVSDAGLERLKKLKNLRVLSLNNTQVSDVGVEHLCELPDLKTLNVENTQVTEAGIKKIRKTFPKCYIGWYWEQFFQRKSPAM